MEEKIYEINWEECEYCRSGYYESDTGYQEYDCELLGDNCLGGEFDSGCPFSFKYKIENKETK